MRSTQKIFSITENDVYKPLLNMCHIVEKNASNSFLRMSNKCRLDLELFVPMFRMYDLLGVELPFSARDLRCVSNPEEKMEIFKKIISFAKNKNAQEELR